MEKTKLLLTLTAIITAFNFVGCETVESTSELQTINNETGEITKVSLQSKEYIKNLEDGCYYIRHNTSPVTCEKVYFGNASFTKAEDYQSFDRVMWFKDDFKDIPNMGPGDSLIYYSTSTISEEFILERFKDLGCSVGLRGLQPTDTDRFTISTNVNDDCSYPNGDTDKILQSNNDTIFVDSINSGTTVTPLRKIYELDDTRSNVTQYGTISFLTENGIYNIVTYDGTIKNEISAKANVRILGSYEVETIQDYEFEDQAVVNIKIPENYNSGYYLVNGAGIFRYIKDPSLSYGNNNKDAWNVPNITKDIYVDSSTNTYTADETPSTPSFAPTSTVIPQDSLTVSKEGKINIQIDVYDYNGNLININDYPNISAYMISPTSSTYGFQKAEHGFSMLLEANDLGKYTIEYSNMAGFTTKVSATSAN